MAIDVFARIGDIKGESQDAKHKDEIEVSSWSWGVAQTGTTGGGSGKPTFSDLTFLHNVDRASPRLYEACASGTQIPQAILSARKAGGSQQEYLVVKMSDVLVTTVQMSASGGGDQPEHVSLRFARVELEYKPQKPDGSLDAGVFFRYDLKQNKTW